MRIAIIWTLLAALLPLDVGSNPAPLDQAAIDACAGARGTIRCLDRGTKYVNCNGQLSVGQPVAAGQTCKDGVIVAAVPGNIKSIAHSIFSVIAHPPSRSAAPAPATSSSSAPPPPHSSTPPPPPTTTTAAPAAPSTPNPCPLGGYLLDSDKKPDSCKGEPGSIECRGPFKYVACGVGKIQPCEAPEELFCKNSKLYSLTEQENV